MRGLMLVKDAIQNNKTLEQFWDIINSKNINNEKTAFIVRDFSHEEKDTLIESVERNDGIYSLKMNGKYPPESDFDNEDNSIYCLFPNPNKCFKFVKDALYNN
jgi:hypothetical protein